MRGRVVGYASSDAGRRLSLSAPGAAACASVLLAPADGLAGGKRSLTTEASLVPGRCVDVLERPLVDPDLDSDATERGLGLGESVVDVGTQRVQRHLALDVPLGAAHLGATEATAALDPDALGAVAHRGADRLLHRSAERDTARELLGHALSDQLSVELRLLDLDDVEPDVDRLAVDLLTPSSRAATGAARPRCPGDR